MSRTPALPGEFAPLTIGNLQLEVPVVLAPMAGITNVPFRTLCRQFGAGLYVSEMLGARAIAMGDQRTLELAEFGEDETIRSIQLYATDAEAAALAAKRLVTEGAVDHIDMNFGCPAPKVTRHGGGAALPFKTRLYGDIVSQTVKAAGDVPVTVKFRKGIDDDHITFLDAGRIAEDAGAAAVALHARTAEQLYSGQAQWEAIAELKETVTTVPVLGNGDIWEGYDAVRMMRETGCDGVVVGRGCLGRPWLFRELNDVFSGRDPQEAPNMRSVAEIMMSHAALLVDRFGEHRGIRSFASTRPGISRVSWRARTSVETYTLWSPWTLCGYCSTRSTSSRRSPRTQLGWVGDICMGQRRSSCLRVTSKPEKPKRSPSKHRWRSRAARS